VEGVEELAGGAGRVADQQAAGAGAREEAGGGLVDLLGDAGGLVDDE